MANGNEEWWISWNVPANICCMMYICNIICRPWTVTWNIMADSVKLHKLLWSLLTLRGSVVWTERSHLNLRSRAETVIWKIIVIISSAVRRTCSETRLTLPEGATKPHASVSWVGLAMEDFSVQFILFLSHTVEYKHSDKNLWHWHIFLFENCHVKKH